MLKSIYKKIKEDFDFLLQYGFRYYDDFKHNVWPSVLFRSDHKDLRIGYKFDEKTFYIFEYNLLGSFRAKELLCNFEIYGKTYKSQKEHAKKNLLEHLLKVDNNSHES